MTLSPTIIGALLLLIAAGIGLSMQAPINAVLARHTSNVLMAACLSFFVGFVLLLAVTLLRGDWPPSAQLAQAPWWVWIGGTFGVLYIVATAWTVPIVGVLTMQVAVVLGQVVAALVVDRMGAFGVPVQDITWPRLAGVLMIAGGLVMTRL
jgi:transporter family-2 protein